MQPQRFMTQYHECYEEEKPRCGWVDGRPSAPAQLERGASVKEALLEASRERRSSKGLFAQVQEPSRVAAVDYGEEDELRRHQPPQPMMQQPNPISRPRPPMGAPPISPAPSPPPGPVEGLLLLRRL